MILRRGFSWSFFLVWLMSVVVIVKISIVIGACVIAVVLLPFVWFVLFVSFVLCVFVFGLVILLVSVGCSPCFFLVICTRVSFL